MGRNFALLYFTAKYSRILLYLLEKL